MSGNLEIVIADQFRFRNGKMRKAVEIPDLHIPFHDKEVLPLVYDMLSYEKPDVINILGDLVDCYAISRFDKDPKRIYGLQEEFNIAKEVIGEFKNRCPKALITYTEGNHEKRIPNFIKKYPGLYGLDALLPENLMGLSDLEVEFVRSNQTLFLNKNLLLLHGHKEDGGKLSQHSGYSAKLTLEKIGISNYRVHSHRLGNSFKTDFKGVNGAWEGGCLCRLDPEYMKFPNWQQGVGLIYFDKKRFFVEQVPIIDGEFVLNGWYYRK